MSEQKPKRSSRRRKPKQNYVPRTNAVHVTLYDPSGGALAPEIVEQAQEAVLKLALDNRLLIGVATT